MISLAEAGTVWLAAVAVYLVLPLAWDYLVRWAATWAGRPGLWARAVRGWRGAPYLQGMGQLLYYLAIPYAALLSGVADARRLGLAGMPRWPEMPAGMLTGLGGVVLVAWLWRRLASACYRRSARPYLLLPQRRLLQTPLGWAQLVGQVLCLQVSWAFVRGVAIWWLGLYPGVFVGLGLTGAAWILRPSTRKALADASTRPGALLAAHLALLSALVFLYAENLWLCAAIHCLGFLGATLASGRAHADAGAAS